MKILAIETSCDETAAAVVEKLSSDNLVWVVSDVKATSQEMHERTGGVVPEVAAREQLRSILPVIREILVEAAQISNDKFLISKQALHTNDQLTHWVKKNIDALAVTVGPGLVGSLLVGVETAKALAWAWEKPLIPVNHLVGHLYANWIIDEIPDRLARNLRHAVEDDSVGSDSLPAESSEQRAPKFPAIGFVVSGGHTDLVLMKSHDTWEWIGGTRDDAAGECFDKCARVLLGVPYPGGAAISAYAEKFQASNSKLQKGLPRPMRSTDSLEMSFSGLKTALVNEVRKGEPLTEEDTIVLAAELQAAVVDTLIEKLALAVERCKPRSVVVGGGVVANNLFRTQLEALGQTYSLPVFYPPLPYCSDNAVVIGAAGLFRPTPLPIERVKADPGLAVV